MERGLLWLAKHQEPCGGWAGASGHKRGDGYLVFFDESWQQSRGEAHPGVTGLAGLAFLAAGHVPGRGSHGGVVERAVDYMIRCAGGQDYIVDGGSRMYGHAFAVLFLTQVYGMTLTPNVELSELLRGATSHIVRSQNRNGGWRYVPGTEEADLSVTVCQVQALRAARNVGVHVPRVVIDRVIAYVEDSRIEGGPYAGAFYYKIFGRAARTKTSFAINAAAVTTLHSAGVYNSKRYQGAIDFLLDSYDDVHREDPGHFAYWYGNYYAVQALRMEGKAVFSKYWQRISRDLLRMQRPDGSFHNSVGPGDAFSTAIACLILAAPLGYLPIYQY